CSHALQMAIEAVANAGENILVPHPGFPLYSTLCRPHNIVDKPYKIDMTGEDVRIDLSYMATIIDDNTKAIIVNNPGNPTGGVFTKEHLEEILAFAHQYKLIIIADEIYGDLVYNGATFY
ncbi:aminotransferase class I/II-fold pyridoxal phosphate-dependent enzyme, partial [Escherichia coli]|nr:aminotransferase class I/II-fold pyridoxal phosphate-dependent enzyme [Escherichia coli]